MLKIVEKILGHTRSIKKLSLLFKFNRKIFNNLFINLKYTDADEHYNGSYKFENLVWKSKYSFIKYSIWSGYYNWLGYDYNLCFNYISKSSE